MSRRLPHQSLQDAFAEVFDRSADDPVEHILALTYEFDDQQLLNLVAGRPLGESFEPRPLDLQKISAVAPVVIYDARKTGAFNLVPHFMELLPVKMPAYSCHHSKAYLVVTRDAAHLWLGSMNLTRTGLFSNREVFCAYRLDAEHTDDAALFLDFAELLASGHASHGSQTLSDIVAALGQRATALRRPPAVGAPRLVSSGYHGAGLEQLGALWQEWMGPAAPDRVFAVSPFFDHGQEGDVFAEQLRRTLGDFTALHVVTDQSCVEGLSQAHFPGPARLTLQAIAAEISAEEVKRIEAANEGASTRGRVLVRKLHAKVLVLLRGHEALVYVGSANFTCKAWNGDNRELGVAWKTRDKDLVRKICHGLEVGTCDLAGSLPPTAPPLPLDDEDYADLPGYPDFVQSIVLEETGVGSDRFHFRVQGDDLDALAGYVIYWGQVRLQFDGGRSNPLPAETLFARLLGGRNLAFQPLGHPDRLYFVPFRHADTLFAKREQHVHPSAEDWMAFQLGVGTRRADGGGLLDDEEDGLPPREAPLDAGREQNPVVRMQRYLSLFSSMEREFVTRHQRAMQLPDPQRSEQWRALVERPLQTLATVLTRQHKPSADPAQELSFKLGELVLLARHLPGASTRSVELARGLAAHLPPTSTDPVAARYLAHCRNQS
ncbi:hypothetical protein [Variovorax saccharolyticus]|uniref:hypothetical protein n=1 Tax=Variovorax saccharolyticus TaxID=3053516 RepID=UPI002575C7C0|nr:hypothetical protein [Variovorax sp. J22R187]MDM0022179.1 hypothetical protein [Variovorax sp. J22R187]